MIYSGYELDENSKALICPNCKNEEITVGSHCKICGYYLINRCSYDENYDSCGKLADGNARYCVYCGAETTYLQNGLLKPWDAENDKEVIKPDEEEEFLNF